MPAPLPPLHRITAAFLFLIAALSIVLAADSPKKTYRLPAGDAVAALKRFSEQSGEQIVFPVDKVRGVKTNAVQGEFTSREALELMLNGTALVAVHDEKTGALSVRLQPSKPPLEKNGAGRTLSNDLSAPATHASPTRVTGAISGRVFNPVTGEYVRNAEVRIQGTNRLAITEADGSFHFQNVPEGQMSLVVVFAGYHAATETLNLSAGQTATREISISSMLSAKTADGTIRMREFVVSSDLEGNAKAIMEQRRSMNIINSVASDAFGDIGEGNVGEFLKNVPGIELDYVDSLIRAPRLRGMEPQYTSVAIDGVRVAAADGQMAYASTENSSGGESVRSPGFEAISLNNIESIEVSKTLSADMDADAPAGAINFKSKRAFDRKGRRIAWQARFGLNSEEFHFNKTYGPGDEKKHKFAPGWSLEYSDVFFGNKLGVILSINQTTTYSENYSIDNTAVNRTKTATDQRPAVFTAIALRDVPGTTERFSTGLNADYKASPHLVLSLSADYNDYLVQTRNKNINFVAAANNTTAGGRSSIIGSDPLMAFETSNVGGVNRAVGLGTGYFDKATETITLVPRVEYKKGSLLLEAKGSYSRAENTYGAYSHGFVAGALTDPLTNINFRFERTDPFLPAWKVTQISGPDYADLRNYTNPRITETDRLIVEKRYSAQLDFRLNLKWRFLSSLKAGVKAQEMRRNHDQKSPFRNYTYTGPGGGTTGSWAGFPSPHVFDMGATGAEFFSAPGVRRTPVFPDPTAIGATLLNHPEYFTNTVPTAATYFNATVRDTKRFLEQVPSGYLMGNTRFNRLQVQAGVRWEKTITKAREADPRKRSEVLAAGFAVDAAGMATTIPGVEYQYFSKPKVWRSGEYDAFFPSVSGKYRITENFDVHVGFNKAISRPALNHIAGVWSVNELARTVQVPNPSLLPERSGNSSARLSYYLKPVGNLAVGVFQNDISNLRTTAQFTAEEFGYANDATYGDYTFLTQTNGVGTRRFRGMEVEYSQHLSFLPGILRGLNLSGSYVRNYASLRRAGLVPHRLSGGVGFKYRGLNLRFNATWADDTPWLTSNDTYQPAKAMYDVSGGYEFSRRFGLFFSGRNFTDEPRRVYQWVDNTRSSVYLFRYGQTGAAWTFGVKGTL